MMKATNQNQATSLSESWTPIPPPYKKTKHLNRSHRSQEGRRDSAGYRLFVASTSHLWHTRTHTFSLISSGPPTGVQLSVTTTPPQQGFLTERGGELGCQCILFRKIARWQEDDSDDRGSGRVKKETKTSVPLFSIFLWHGTSFRLPQVVVDGQGVHADWHSLGRDDGELLPVRVVLVQLVDHLLADALGARARQLVDLLRVGEVRVERPELAAAVAKQDDQVIGLALLQLLMRRKTDKRCWCKTDVTRRFIKTVANLLYIGPLLCCKERPKYALFWRSERFFSLFIMAGCSTGVRDEI